MRFQRPTSGDFFAGVTVALIALPQGLAYAELAGMPARYGLFASALPSIVAAPFASSPYLQTGATALTSLLTFGALHHLAELGTPHYIELAALLALMVGVVRVALGLLGGGRVAYLLSQPVLMGFTSGAAILIIASQLPRIVDVDVGDRGVLSGALFAVDHPARWHGGAIAFAVATVVFVFGGNRIHRLFPGILVAVVVGTVVSAVVGYGGPTVGSIDRGFVPFTLRFDWSSLPELMVPAAAIALVGFAEPASIARTYSAQERTRWDSNREMVAQGVANLGAAVSGAFPVGGSFGRSSLNRRAGAASPWAGAITGSVILLALPLAPLLENLPKAVLAAVVIGAVANLVRLRPLFALVTRAPTQAVIGLGTLVATLATAPSIERGVLIGIALSIGGHLWREIRVSASSERRGDVLTVAPKGVLWFATVASVDSVIRRELAEHRDLTKVVLDLGGVGRLDYTVGVTIEAIASELAAANVEVELVNVPPGAARAVGLHLSEYHDSDGPDTKWLG